MRGWLRNFLDLVTLEAKNAGIGLGKMLGFGFAAIVLLITGWLALIGCAVAALVENNILGWTGALLSVAVLNFAGTAGLAFLASRYCGNFRFSATRRQLGLLPVSAPDHD